LHCMPLLCIERGSEAPAPQEEGASHPQPETRKISGFQPNHPKTDYENASGATIGKGPDLQHSGIVNHE